MNLQFTRYLHYCTQDNRFTEEELDFIINYDIKYRMGKDNEEDNNGN